MSNAALAETTALTPAFKPSLEQQDIINFVHKGKGHIMVVARAGTGKTSLILQCLPIMMMLGGSIAIAAFNNKIAKEIVRKIGQTNFRADTGTFHSFGARAIRKVFPKTKIDGKKFDRIAEALEIPKHIRGFVRKLSSFAKQHGFGVGGLKAASDKNEWLKLVEQYDLDELISDELVQQHIATERLVNGVEKNACVARDELILAGLRFAHQSLNKSRELAAEVIDFDDMLWLPLLLNMKMPQFDWVCVDEAQDSNPVRREMAIRMTKPTGRRFWCGDDKQSIAMFAGADSDAMDQIAIKDRCTKFPMTVTFRCGKAIVELAKTIVPDYKAAETNPEGEVLSMDEATFDKTDMLPTDAIICRNTAPLVQTAYRLIRRGIACHVEGREIGNGLLTLAGRWTSIKTLTALQSKLSDYLEKQVAKLNAANKEQKAEELTDRVETIFAIMEGMPKGSTVADLKAQITNMFSDSDDSETKVQNVTLLTAHKSKGLEFDRVFGLGVNKYMPSKYAKTPEALIQEDNLRYVLITRAINTLVLVDVA